MSGTRGAGGASARRGTRGARGVDYYLDSVNGNDANTGRSLAQAFQNLSAVPLSNGVRVGFVRGSQWRASLDCSVYSNVRLVAVGDVALSLPKFDGADIASSGGWSKTGGLTNVYDRTWAHEEFNGVGQITVWEDGARLAWAASQAACDAAAGSFTTTAVPSGTSHSVYIHPTGNGDPASNGKIYEITKRYQPVTNGTSSYAEGLHCTRGGSNNGSYEQGRGSTAFRCMFTFGHKHNALQKPNSRFDHCVFYQTESSARIAASTMAVTHDAALLAGDRGDVLACYFDGGVGYVGECNYAHQSGGAVNFTEIIVDGCFMRRANVGADAGNCSLLTVRNLYAEQINAGIVVGFADAITLTNVTAILNASHAGSLATRIIDTDNPIVVRDLRAILGGQASQGALRCLNIDVENSTVLGASASFEQVFRATAGTLVHSKNNVFQGFDKIYSWSALNVAPTYSDFNVYYNTDSANLFMEINSASYNGLAAFLAGTNGFDDSSAQSDPLFTGSPAANAWTFQAGSPANTGGRLAGSRLQIAAPDWTALNTAWDAGLLGF